METKETVTTEVVNLSNKNEKLCQELTEIDQLAQQLERHKEEVLETADKELEEAKVCLGCGGAHYKLTTSALPYPTGPNHLSYISTMVFLPLVLFLSNSSFSPE